MGRQGGGLGWWARTMGGGAVLAAFAVLLGLVGLARVQAQEGTPGFDVSAGCVVPRTAASPRATSDGTGPEVGFGSPTAVPDPAVAQAVLAAEVEGVARALAACLTAGDAETVVALVTEGYLGQAYGGGEPLTADQYLAFAGDLPPLVTEIRAFGDIRAEGADRVSADVVYVIANQLRHGRWTFVRGEGDGGTPAADAADEGDDAGWQVDSEEPLPVSAPAEAATVEVELEDGAFALDPEGVEGAAVVLEGRNTGERDHEMLVLRLDEGVTTESLLQEPGPRLPEGIAFVGQATVPAGGEATLTLVDLDAGTYTLVCLLPDEDGIPDLADGMEAELEVG